MVDEKDGLMAKGKKVNKIKIEINDVDIESQEPVGEPESTDANPTDPKQTDPKQADPKQTDANPTDPKQAEPKATGPKATGPKQAGPKATDANPTDPNSGEDDKSFCCLFKCCKKDNDDNDDDEYIDDDDDYCESKRKPDYITTTDDLYHHINIKKRRLEESKKLLEVKYAHYKACNSCWNISTILLSSGLTLIESFKHVFLSEESEGMEKDFFNYSPIILGSVITCTASFLKFMKYQEMMEEIYIVISKCIEMICKLKNKKEEIRLRTKICENYEEEDDFTNNVNKKIYGICPTDNTIKDSLIKDYLNNICIEYSQVAMEVEKYIDPDDYRKYLKLLNKLEYHKHQFAEEKRIFFHEHKKRSKIKFREIDRKFKTLYCEKCCCC